MANIFEKNLKNCMFLQLGLDFFVNYYGANLKYQCDIR